MGGKIVKFTTPESILHKFFETRLGFYHKRKDYLLQVLRREQLMLSNKARFIKEVCNETLIVNNRKKIDLLKELQEKEYDLFLNNDKKESEDSESEESDDNPTIAELTKGYEYLLGMRIWSLTLERVKKLCEELDEKTRSIDELENTSPSTIWLRDLDAIEDALDERDAEMSAVEEKQSGKKNTRRVPKKKTVAKVPKKKVAPPKKKKVEVETEESDESFVIHLDELGSPETTEHATISKQSKMKKSFESDKSNNKMIINIDDDSSVDLPQAVAQKKRVTKNTKSKDASVSSSDGIGTVSSELENLTVKTNSSKAKKVKKVKKTEEIDNYSKDTTKPEKNMSSKGTTKKGKKMVKNVEEIDNYSNDTSGTEKTMSSQASTKRGKKMVKNVEEIDNYSNDTSGTEKATSSQTSTKRGKKIINNVEEIDNSFSNNSGIDFVSSELENLSMSKKTSNNVVPEKVVSPSKIQVNSRSTRRAGRARINYAINVDESDEEEIDSEEDDFAEEDESSESDFSFE